jgi:hypothetical protein
MPQSQIPDSSANADRPNFCRWYDEVRSAEPKQKPPVAIAFHLVGYAEAMT